MSDARLQEAYRAHQSGDLNKAAQLYRAILQTGRSNFEVLYLLGYLHVQQKKWEEADHLIGEALRLNPRSLGALYQRGHALLQLARYEDALTCFDIALAVQPATPEFLFLRGNALLSLYRAAEALSSYDAALAVKPEFPEAWSNRGNALTTLLRHAEALVSYDRALAGLPGNLEILHLRALALLQIQRYEDAAEAFARVLAIAPDFPYARGNCLYSRLNTCNWHGLEKDRQFIAENLETGARIIAPFQHAVFSSSLENQFLAAHIWASDRYPPPLQKLWRGERYRHEKIRIAYLSSDFHAHATAALLTGVVETHDRVRFHIVAISFGPDDASEMRRRLVAAFDRFIDAREKTDLQVARLIREMEIDIAVDLKGYTENSRPGILAHRPAPVQVNYLGFPATMGTDSMDYLIADETVIPSAAALHYSEKIVDLPDSYQANDSRRKVPVNTLTRAIAGLPQQGFVFCCFNNNFKILPEIFAVWMRLLSEVDGSVLWLLEDNTAAVRNLRSEAASQGIRPERLVFAPRVTYDTHLARHRLADLFLDTLPYNAHTTASDALWSGLPVLTCLGETFAGRVSASLLRTVGLPELVTESLDAYQNLALSLARDPSALTAIQARLAVNRGVCPLFDTGRFTRNLERTYVLMSERARRGLPPESFAVAAQQG
jgi:protein O-GlcNAc transferase